MDGAAQAPVSSTGHDGVFVCRAGTGMEQVATCVPCAALCPLGLRTQHLRLLYSVFCFAGRLYGVGRGQDRGARRVEAGWEIPGTRKAARCSGSGGAYVLAAFSGLLRPCNCCAAGRRGGCAGLGRSTAWGEGRERGPPVQSFTHSPSCPQKLIMGSRALELSRTLIIWIIWHQPRRRAAGHSLGTRRLSSARSVERRLLGRLGPWPVCCVSEKGLDNLHRRQTSSRASVLWVWRVEIAHFVSGRQINLPKYEYRH